ncbi:MBL fold metallo-hydrolase [Gilliamella sp. B2894]|uniref:MBL fold metallo-hydrolase n=1 Tax=unclassified Gilliamella TaxID=2685620 RepID=UPI002269A61E|nr:MULTISPECIES: MBL fold metallo-hydrolase [unclassified Gilliamella]MCX8656783.1 MBL fold metallo-hydrolase [Gilliamella sp. B2894]MCX8694211.1 MBL fold metallo-hydrolase [Gilliamella sp. B2881]MCX8696706.1 MBL fold metallo-hydrolase [Gilliamella sp. B2828]
MVNKQGADNNKAHRLIKKFDNIEPFNINFIKTWLWYQRRKVPEPKGGYQAFSQTWCEAIDLTLPNDRVWWIGHSTNLIRLNNKMILTDPIFSKRASPLRISGPKRHTPPALTIDQLPNIDFVLISHNHYDHLDNYSIHQLVKRFPNLILVIPLGLKEKLNKWGAKQVIELNWYESMTFDNLTFTATPARHWSNRGLFDINTSLWCGWVMQSNVNIVNKTKTVYFMGDTGYSPSLKEIGQRFTCIDLALIPIGAYSPRRLLQSQHIDPIQAVQLYDELNCHEAVAIHWGTFELSDESLDEPAQQLYEHRADRYFHLLKIGGSLAINHYDSGLK